MPNNPYADILAQREARHANRVPVALHIRASILDTGQPSQRAIDARNQRIADSVREANERAAMLEARGDYR